MNFAAAALAMLFQAGPPAVCDLNDFKTYFQVGTSAPEFPDDRSVQEFAEIVLDAGSTKVTLTGHADDGATEQANLDRSRARAEAVAARLAASGVDRSIIEVVAVGSRVQQFSVPAGGKPDVLNQWVDMALAPFPPCPQPRRTKEAK